MSDLCTKQGFVTPEAASRQMQMVARSSWIGRTANVYQCGRCGLWHWGHAKAVDKAFARAERAHSLAKWPPDCSAKQNWWNTP